MLGMDAERLLPPLGDKTCLEAQKGLKRFQPGQGRQGLLMLVTGASVG